MITGTEAGDDRQAADTPTSDRLGQDITITGHEGAYEVRDFLSRNQIGFTYEPGDDGPVRVHTTSGRELVAPSLRELADGVGCRTSSARDSYDLIVVGAGPAGLAAAVYGAAEGLDVLVLESVATGGQAGTSSLIENYPGFTDGISGSDLAERTRLQAVRLGAEIVLTATVVDGGGTSDGRHTVILDDGTVLAAGAVVCSTGVDWRRLDLPGLEALDAHGVYYGAATSEAPGVAGKDVLIVGGGNSAGQAAMFFSRVARAVTMVVRGENLSSTLSRYLLNRIEASETIEVVTCTEVTAVSGGDWLRTATLTHLNGTSQQREVHALFICIGGVPQTKWAGEHGVAVDDAGYLLTGVDVLAEKGAWSLERAPDTMETSQPLMYAVGDVRHGSTKRIATAMGEGALVVKIIQDRLAEEGMV